MKIKKALIHDWFTTIGGAEMVVKAINEIWDDFNLYSLIHSFNSKQNKEILNNKLVTTSFLQNIPTAKKDHRKFLQLYPYAIERLNVNEADLIISSSSSVAKGVITNANQLHICYCHSPARYAWDLYHQSLAEMSQNWFMQFYAKYVLHKFRIWDQTTVNRVDCFVANSKYIAKRIKRVYNRDSVVIYPPIDTEYFEFHSEKEDFYLAFSRMVPYKKFDLIVEAFNQMPDKKLVIIGDGPEFKKIKKLAKDNIMLKGFLPREELKHYLQRAKALVFAAEEDFGIAPLEAQSCGTPVIAFGKGGALESIVDKKTGVFFPEQSAQSIKEAVQSFDNYSFDYNEIREHALFFSKENFQHRFKTFVEDKYNQHIKENHV